jgi:phenylacetate-CoA ligase
MSIRPASKGVKQAPPLKVLVEISDLTEPGDLAERIERDIRATLLVSTTVELVSKGTLPRTDYKSKLVDFSEAGPAMASD